MSAGTLISVEEYLTTSYSPDREFLDGMVVERNVGDNAHALLQLALGAYLRRRRREWEIEVFTELRICVRPRWYRIPDVCAYALPRPQERFPSTLPLLWIEILSEDDRMVHVWQKAQDLVESGVPYVWIIDPNTLESELRTAAGRSEVREKTLRLADSPIGVPLAEVLAE